MIDSRSKLQNLYSRNKNGEWRLFVLGSCAENKKSKHDDFLRR